MTALIDDVFPLHVPKLAQAPHNQFFTLFITRTMILITIIYGRKTNRFVEGKKAKIGLRLKRIKIGEFSRRAPKWNEKSSFGGRD
jgi:hypothetical protein